MFCYACILCFLTKYVCINTCWKYWEFLCNLMLFVTFLTPIMFNETNWLIVYFRDLLLTQRVTFSDWSASAKQKSIRSVLIKIVLKIKLLLVLFVWKGITQGKIVWTLDLIAWLKICYLFITICHLLCYSLWCLDLFFAYK